MFVWLFQLADIFVLGVILGTHFGLITSWRLILGGSVYLIGKGVWFRDFMSLIDIVIGIYLVFMLFGARWVFTWVALAWFTYKFFIGVVLR